MARSWATVTTVTSITTRASSLGTLSKSLRDGQANVPITTIIIIPVKAARGIISIRLERNSMKASKAIEAVNPDNLPLPPDSILIMDCPIIAHPPIALKKPHTRLAMP